MDTDSDTEMINRCVNCGMDMGACNPRQFCCKTHCPYDFEQFFEPKPKPKEPELTVLDAEARKVLDIADRLNAKFLENNSDAKLRRILERKWVHARRAKKSKFLDPDPQLEDAVPPPTLSVFKELARKRLKTTVAVDDAEAARIRNLPQHDPDGQANKEWLLARKFRITGSHAAKAIGVQYSTYTCNEKIEEQGLQDLLWGIPKKEQQKPALHFGTKHEADAEAAFKAVMAHLHAKKELKYEHCGLCINRENPFLAMSPDGILTMGGKHHLLEYKCVWGLSGLSVPRKYAWKAFVEGGKLLQRNVGTNEVKELRNLYKTYDELKSGPYGKRKIRGYACLPGEVIHRNLPLKLYYYTQVVHGKYTIDHRNIDTVYFVSWVQASSPAVTQLHPDEFDSDGTQVGFAVWSTPHGTVQITHLKFDDTVSANWAGDPGLQAIVEKYYFGKYFPLMLLKELGCLDHVPVGVERRREVGRNWK
jgi:hypothetical protein